MASRRREMPVDGSWRIVEGENDSFDTSILPSTADDDDPISVALATGRASFSSGLPSQMSSQGNPAAERSFQGRPYKSSQDSIGDFVASTSQDSQNLLLDPFRPSIHSASGSEFYAHEPELRMPRIAIAQGGPGGRARRKDRPQVGGLGKRRAQRRPGFDHDDQYEGRGRMPPRAHLAQTLPATVYDALAATASGALWVCGVFFQAVRIAKLPLTIILAVYLILSGLLLTQDMASKSISNAMAPICNIPGMSLLSVPFCSRDDGLTLDGRRTSAMFPRLRMPSLPSIPSPCRVPGASVLPFCSSPTAAPGRHSNRDGHLTTETPLDDIIRVQDKFEGVLAKSAEGVTVPLQIRRASRHVSNLKTLVQHSDLAHRAELVFQLESYVESASHAASALTRFGTRVAGAVDDIINTNDMTMRFVRSRLRYLSGDDTPGGLILAPVRLLGRWWTGSAVERSVFAQYAEHTALVAERVAVLITEAEGVLRFLTEAENHLGAVASTAAISTAYLEQHPHMRPDGTVIRTSILRNILESLHLTQPQYDARRYQLELLGRLEGQIADAAAQVEALIAALEAMQAELEDLHGRLSAPSLLDDMLPTTPEALALQVAAIDAGVRRLTASRRHIFDESNRRRLLAETHSTSGEALDLAGSGGSGF